jgi:hypothetical protein
MVVDLRQFGKTTLARELVDGDRPVSDPEQSDYAP